MVHKQACVNYHHRRGAAHLGVQQAWLLDELRERSQALMHASAMDLRQLAQLAYSFAQVCVTVCMCDCVSVCVMDSRCNMHAVFSFPATPLSSSLPT